MVYRGPRSKACHMCRETHRRCDQKVPSCGNCRRAKVVCPGYRSQLELMFVHETDDTVQKQQKRRATHPCQPLSPARGDLALGYFYKVHMIHADARSNIACSSVQDSWLVTSMQALGLATYASTCRQPLETIKAREYYGSAIVKVNIALQSEVYSKRDSTLLAVVILTYFETMAGSDRGGVAAWSQHIDGTAALIQKRGVEQMRTAEGRTLFLLATANMISNCSRLALRIPESIHTTWSEGLKDLGLSNDPIWRVHSAWLKLVDFYSDVVNERKDFTAIVPEAFAIDRELATAFDNASPLWEYDVKPSRIRSILPHLPEYSHLYKFPLSVQMWNAARGGRIVLHSIIPRTLWHICLTTPSATVEHHAEQLRKSDKLVRRMKMDVLASVPQLLGFELASEAGESQPLATYADIASMTQNFEGPMPIPPGSGSSGLLTLRSDHLPVLRTCGFNFIWHLGLVGKNTKKADPLRGTICNYLRLAGARLGLQMAFLFAETLERGEMLTMT